MSNYFYLIYPLIVLVVGTAIYLLFLRKESKFTLHPNRNSRSNISLNTHKFQKHPLEDIIVVNNAIKDISLQLEDIEKKLYIASAGDSKTETIEKKFNLILERLAIVNSAIKEKSTDSISRTSELPDIDPESIQLAPEWNNSSANHQETFYDDFVNSYNRALVNRVERNSFWEKFQTVQIGNRNASDQRAGRTSETDFRTADVGDFIAVKNPDDGSYFVVPNFTFSLDETSYRYGGLHHAFNSDYRTDSIYTGFQIEIPAKFFRSGDMWKLKLKGRLALIS